MTALAAPEAPACSNRGQGDGFEAIGHVHAQRAILNHLSTVQARMKSAQEALTRFEEQGRYVGQLRFALQQVSQLLRQEEYINHARIDAALARLGFANVDTPKRLDGRINSNANQSAGAQTGPQATNQAVICLVGRPNIRGNRRRNHRRVQLDVLRHWFDEHAADPYPSPEEKEMLSHETQMEVRQVEQCVHMTPATLRFAVLKYRMLPVCKSEWL